ncbi:MAG TPA: right-handed parallel beta-helix repeat-containing protein, partial [Anaerolineae bacterium]|nr:right-handed parallel beta-helix repeat-containing protein [Anaerolineae bacterium]
STITNCLIYSNTAQDGSAIFANYGSDKLYGSEIWGNTGSGPAVTVYGGSGATLQHNTIRDNTGGNQDLGGGVGIYDASNVTVQDNTITGNTTSFYGGGVSVKWGSNITLSHNTMAGNTASQGGGVFVSNANAILSSNVITGNSAYLGGGLLLEESTSTLVNNVVADNRVSDAGAGIYVRRASPRLLHTTIARNSGGDGSGIYVTNLGSDYSTVAMTNTILFSHTVGIAVMAGNTATLDGTLWQANGTDRSGAGTINHSHDYSGDPAFQADGYHLAPGSQALDRGVNAGVTTDIDGESRPQGAGYDLGADEFLSALLWQKRVRIGNGSWQDWDAGPFLAADGDTVTIVDRVWVTHTAAVTFVLGQAWGNGLSFQSQSHDAGTVTTGSGTLTWNANNVAANQWHTLTTTLRVNGSDWTYETVTETLNVTDAATQPGRRRFKLLNQSAAANCHVRVNNSSTEYHTVQAGIDAAQAGDVVKVAGTCTVVGQHGNLTQIAYIAKNITLQGGYTTTNWTTPDPAAHPTTLDAQGQGRVLYLSGSGIHPTIAGLRITGGDASKGGGSNAGGGIYANQTSSTITNCLVYSNTAEDGSAIYLNYGSDKLYGSEIWGNTGSGPAVEVYGGSGTTLQHNTIRDNTGGNSYRGGGVSIYYASNVTVQDNTISGNTTPFYGGGVSAVGSSNTALSRNTIAGNTANQGGGVFIYNANAILSGNVITGNTAYQGGGALFDEGTSTLVNNVVADNRASDAGAGIYVRRAALHLTHTTIARNSDGDGSGLYVTDESGQYSTVVLTNTIIFSHAVGIAVAAGNTATLDATLWQANGTDRGGAGTINHSHDYSGDPAFKADGYHLRGNSAAIDKGVNAGVTTDIDGDTRPMDDGYDLGADETAKKFYIYLPLAVRKR